jgi:hypothetical protein
LEAVSHAVNIKRGDAGRYKRDRTHCKSGHEFTPENTYVSQSGGRACRACRKRWLREWVDRRKARVG